MECAGMEEEDAGAGAEYDEGLAARMDSLEVE